MELNHRLLRVGQASSPLDYGIGRGGWWFEEGRIPRRQVRTVGLEPTISGSRNRRIANFPTPWLQQTAESNRHRPFANH